MDKSKIKVEVEDNTEQVKAELDKAVEKILFAWGTECVAGCVNKASEIDEVTGRPTVDTGRYRAGFGFITPTQGKMSGTPTTTSEPTDDFSNQRANKDTVVIGNNVEYAPYLEVGTSKTHARNIMRNGIDSKIDTMKKDMEQILKGQGQLIVGSINENS